jgi:tRNA dimethylallyltransferase
MPADTRPSAIAVMGPTASGKTAFAVALAQRLGGEIVSVDSALVYRGLDIGAAKPDARERGGVPHHLIDVCDPWQPYSAAQFAADAGAAVAGIVARGRIPILAGGTGLYFRALLHGLAPMPEADADMRAAIASEAAQVGWAALHDELARADPEAAARIHATDAQRIQRALEVYRLTGRPISHWQRQATGQSSMPLRVLELVLSPPERGVLHARIAQRFDAMLAAGFLDEVRALLALPQIAAHPAPQDLPALRAVGYRQAWEHLREGVDAAAFRDRAIAATRQLAKRQLTWLRARPGALWFDPATAADALWRTVHAFVPGNARGLPASPDDVTVRAGHAD